MSFQYGFTSCVIVRVVYNFNLIRKTIKACVLCVFLCVHGRKDFTCYACT